MSLSRSLERAHSKPRTLAPAASRGSPVACSCRGPAWGSASGPGALAQTTRAPRPGDIALDFSRGLRQHAPCGSNISVYPALRNSMDFREGPATARGEAAEDQKRASNGSWVRGCGKSMEPRRVTTLGGLASISQAPKSKVNLARGDQCPLGLASPSDSLAAT